MSFFATKKELKIFIQKKDLWYYDDIKNNLIVVPSTLKLNILYIISQFDWCGVKVTMLISLHYIPSQID